MKLTNPQVQWLLEKRLISLELAVDIEKECGEGDIGLVLGHLLYTGKIGPGVVQDFLARNNKPSLHLQWESP